MYIEYKILRRGYETHYLPRRQVRGTSSTCPMCGRKNRLNGHVFLCKVCGFVADRHFVGAHNIAVRCGLRMWGETFLPNGARCSLQRRWPCHLRNWRARRKKFRVRLVYSLIRNFRTDHPPSSFLICFLLYTFLLRAWPQISHVVSLEEES